MNCKTFSQNFWYIKEYKLISKIGEGTFSEVIKASNIKTGKLVAIKCMKEKITIDKVIWVMLSCKVKRSRN